MYLYLSRHDEAFVYICLRGKRGKVLKEKWKSLLYIYFILVVLTCVLFFLKWTNKKVRTITLDKI